MNSIGQFFLAFFIGWTSYLLAMVPLVNEGSRALLVLAFMAALLTSFALTPIFIVGLPIRWIPAIHHWWRAHWWLSIVLAVAAVALMWTLLWWPALSASRKGEPIDWPYPWAGVGGWFLAMFAAAHFYPPGKREPA